MPKTERKDFLAKMFEEAMKPYEHPGESQTQDEKEFLPLFMMVVKSDGLILDLGGMGGSLHIC